MAWTSPASLEKSAARMEGATMILFEAIGRERRTPNAERPISNSEDRIHIELGVRRWAFDVCGLLRIYYELDAARLCFMLRRFSRWKRGAQRTVAAMIEGPGRASEQADQLINSCSTDFPAGSRATSESISARPTLSFT